MIFKSKLAAVGVGILSAGAVFAMAATLGGIDGENLGADAAVVASCMGSSTDSIHIDYVTEYDAGTDGTLGGRYEVTGVTVTGLKEACIGQTMDITLSNAEGTKQAKVTAGVVVDGNTDDNETTLTILNTESTVGTLDGNVNMVEGFDAEEVDNIGIVIQTT